MSSTFDIVFSEEAYQDLNNWVKEIKEIENDKRLYLVSLYDKNYFRRKKGNKIVLPKFKDIGYSDEDFSYVKRGILPPRKMYENVYPMVNSILHEFKYMDILKKRRSNKRTQTM